MPGLAGFLFVITVAVAWIGGALSIWLTRNDPQLTRVIREVGYLHACLEDLADVIEKNTRAIESRFPMPEPYVPGPHIGTTDPGAESAEVARDDEQDTQEREEG